MSEKLVGYVNPDGSGEGDWVAAFHTDCGYDLDLHRGPDGVYDERACPTEADARAAYGDR